MEAPNACYILYAALYMYTSDSNSGGANIACINLYIQVKLLNKCKILRYTPLSDIHVFYQFTYVEKFTLM